MSYKSVNEYIHDTYYLTLAESFLEFAIECGLREDKDSVLRFNEYEIGGFEIVDIKYIKSELNDVTFYFLAKILFICDGEQRMLERLKGKMRGSFSKGFELVDITESSDEDFKYTSDLVPIMKKEDYDKNADRFLKKYYPESLIKPTKIKLDTLAERMGLTYYLANLEEGVQGVIYFAKDKARVITNIKQKTEEIVDVQPGTILIDISEATKRGQGSMRNTFVHEAVHWFFHRNYFERRQLLDKEKTKAVCYRSTSHSCESEQIEWMERQARALAPRILMPRQQALIYYNQMKSEGIFVNDNDNLPIYELNELYMLELASFFGVSKESAKYRLTDLGIDNVAGVDNFVDGKKVPNFTFRENYLKENQTFLIDMQSLVRLFESNSTIAMLYATKKIVYVDGLLVVNKPEYISKGRLTKMARCAIDECALVFNLYSSFDDAVASNEMSYFLYKTNRRVSVQAGIDIDQFNKIVGTSDENQTYFNIHKGKLPSSFGETLRYHMKKRNMTQEALEFESDVNIKYISHLVNEQFDLIKDLQTCIIKVSLALQLSYPYMCDLFAKAQMYLPAPIGNNGILLLCLLGRGRASLPETYKLLETYNRGHLLNLSEKFKTENNL